MKKQSTVKRRKSNDKLDANPKENMDEQWERQEQEKKLEEERQEKV